MQTQQVQITRTYEFPAVPEGWDWLTDGVFVVLFDDAADRFGKVAIEPDGTSSFCESTTRRFHPSMLAAAADLAAEATEWQAVIDAEAAQAPVIDGQPVYVSIPLALRRKGWAWLFNSQVAHLFCGRTERGSVLWTNLPRQEVADAMADLVSDAEVSQ